MRKNKAKLVTMLVTVAGAAAYGAVAGKGVFNRPRFKEQHKALSNYVDNNYPGCSYTPITMHGKGWASAVKRNGRVVVFVYFTKSDEGIYIFTESKEKE